ncbi:MAG TPA: DUF1905 domain-containing protein [Blastocatellia bacterium]|nr:DUF1905 domain-containing protein [Blastocatellia bacterium]
MKPERFKGEVLEGHKGFAIEVPFNPETKWKIAAGPLWRGRRGHRVRARINRATFETFIVPRARRFFLLIDDGATSAARLTPGDIVAVEVSASTTSMHVPSCRQGK